MDQVFFDVQGIGRVQLVQELGASLLVEDESGTRLSLPASRCVRVDQTAAALADQFTGLDMGAEMRAAEFDHSQAIAKEGDFVEAHEGWRGVVLWLSATVGGWVYAVQLADDSAGRPALLMGDEFTVEA